MDKNPKRLGRGLSSLISIAEPPQTPTAPVSAAAPSTASEPPSHEIPVDRIRPNPFQPRQEMRPDELRQLAESIRNTGLIQPIVVRPKDKGIYEIIAGERRWRAAQMAGMTRIPAVVREASEQQMAEMALIENIFREDLNPIERATAYRRYCDEFKLGAEEVAKRLGEDRTTVTNYLRLLDLPGEVKTWVGEGKLSMGQARCLLGIRSPGELLTAAKQAIEQDLSVRAVEKLVREWSSARAQATKPPPTPAAKRPQIKAIEEAFVRVLGTKVEIQEAKRKGSGKVIIHYFNLDDFDRIAERLGVESA